MNKKDKTISGGIVTVRLVNDKYKFLLLRSYSYWDFPKGEIDEGESVLDTAIRETEEETTITKNNLDFKWGNVNKNSDVYKKGSKYAIYYIAETKVETIELPISEKLGKPEHDEWRWADFEEAQYLLNDRVNKILTWANEIINNV